MATSPTVLFQGFNLVTGQALSTAVKGVSASKGRVADSHVSICSGYEELSKTLRISQSASASLFDIAGGDETFEFFSALHSTTTSLHVVVWSRVVTEDQIMTSVEGVIQPPPNDAVADFVASYGDSFVSRLTKGAMFAAVYSFYSRSTTELEQIKTSLSAHGIVDGVIGSASISTSLETFSSHVQVASQYETLMVGTKNVPMPKPADIAAFALAFVGLGEDRLDASVIGWETAGYDTVPGFAGPFHSVRKNRRLLGGSALGQLGSILPAVISAKEGIKAAQAIYNVYGQPEEPSLAPALAEANTDYAALKALVDAYDDNPSQLLALPAKVPSRDRGTPVVEFTIDTNHCRAGVDNATASFDDAPDPAKLIGKGMRLSKITATYDGFLFSIQGYYTDINGNETPGTWCGEHRGYNGTFSFSGIIDRIVMSTRDLGKLSSIQLECGDNKSPWSFVGGVAVDWKAASMPGFFPLAMWGNCWGDNVEGPMVRVGFKLAKLTGVKWHPIT